MLIDQAYIELRIGTPMLKLMSTGDSSATAVNAAAVTAAITDAEAIIYQYLKDIYVYPLEITADTQSEKTLQQICYDIVIYRISGKAYADEELKSVRYRYSSAITSLKVIKASTKPMDGITAITAALDTGMIVNETEEEDYFPSDIWAG